MRLFGAASCAADIFAYGAKQKPTLPSQGMKGASDEHHLEMCKMWSALSMLPFLQEAVLLDLRDMVPC